MGIPDFFKWFVNNRINNAISKNIPNNVSGISFDLNGIFHEARILVYGDGKTMLKTDKTITSAQMEMRMQQIILDKILLLLNTFRPKDYIILAVDGVVPCAKLQQQKQRREKSALYKSKLEKFDTNAITPGTDFMVRLDAFLQTSLNNIEIELPPKVIYSSHLVPGEGEHKIMQYYRSEEFRNYQGNHILYGLDTDLIMLSLLSPINNIHLCRERLDQIVSINVIKNFITQNNKSVDDFVVMMFVLANDFLPHHPALRDMNSSIELLMDIFENKEYNIVENGQITKSGLNAFFDDMQYNELEMFTELLSMQQIYPSDILAESFKNNMFDFNRYRNFWYNKALGYRNLQLYNFINKISNVNVKGISDNDIDMMCDHYMLTMSWVFNYYKNGHVEANQDYFYPYHYAPLFYDLFKRSENTLNQEIIGYKYDYNNINFTVLHQLVSVLPLESIDLLPEELKPLFSSDSILRHMLPASFIIDMDGVNKDKSHLGVGIIPMINKRDVYNAVQQIVFEPIKVASYLPADDLIIKGRQRGKYTPQQQKQSYRSDQIFRPNQNFRSQYNKPTQQFNRPQYIQKPATQSTSVSNVITQPTVVVTKSNLPISAQNLGFRDLSSKIETPSVQPSQQQFIMKQPTRVQSIQRTLQPRSFATNDPNKPKGRMLPQGFTIDSTK